MVHRGRATMAMRAIDWTMRLNTMGVVLSGVVRYNKPVSDAYVLDVLGRATLSLIFDLAT